MRRTMITYRVRMCLPRARAERESIRRRQRSQGGVIAAVRTYLAVHVVQPSCTSSVPQHDDNTAMRPVAKLLSTLVTL